MKVLVTGASGFLGSHIAEQLVAAGHTVRLLLRKTSSRQFLAFPFEEALGDITDPDSLPAAVDGVDTIVHAAGLVKARNEAEFAAGVDRGLDYARALGCAQVHAMAGIPPVGTTPADAEATYVANLHAAAARLAAHGIRLLIEPINTRDMPGYFLTTPEQARRVIAQAATDNLFVQMDLYHCQIMGGDLSERIRANLPLTRHFQIAGVPGRHEPDTGEIDYRHLFELIDGLGYDGWIGCEYRSRGDTSAGLAWAAPYGIGAGRIR